MKNAHLRFGWLTYVKSTEKTTTSIKLHLDRFIGELLPDPPRQAKAHFISVIGGDTQISAISAAISMADRFHGGRAGCATDSSMPGTQCAVFQRFDSACRTKEAAAPSYWRCQKNSPRATCRPIRDRTLLASSDKRFVWASVAHIYGIPGIPEWADWFADELNTHQRIVLRLGIGCDPVMVKGEKEQFLDWLSWGVESDAISFPAQTGSVRWPNVSLKDIFLQAE